MFGGSTGAALHLSAGWNDQARYLQTVNNLPSGRYLLYYEVINQHTNTGIASNYTGVSGTAGDFYGTTNGFVFSTLNSAATGVWIAQAFEFDVAKTANINFNVGFTTSTGGSANGAKLWVDNVLVYRIGDVVVSEADANAILNIVAALDGKAYNATDKTALATAKTTFENNKTLDNYNALNTALAAAQASIAVYETLDAAIAKVESWTSDAQTVTDPMRTKYNNGEYANATTAADIYTEYQAAETAALVASDATVFTSVIINPSFETGDMTGWSAESRSDTGVKDQSNGTYSITSGDAVDGLKLFNSWGGSAENNVYQTIPNLPAGTYQLSALLAGFNGESLVLAANENTNSVVVAGDKTVGYTVNVVFTLSAATDVVIKASNTKDAGNENSDKSFIKADNFILKAYSDPLAALKEQLATLQTEATTTLADETYKNVTGSEKTNLNTLATTTPAETEAAYNTTISDITAAISAFTAAKPSYDAYVEANGIATTLATAVTAPTTAAEAVTRTHELYVNIDAKVTSDFAHDVTDVYNVSFTGFTATNKGQHWSDNAETSYLDQWGTGTVTATQDITLPAGSYVLKATGRADAANPAKAYMSANGTTVNFANNGDTGKGVDTSGAVNYGDGTFANNVGYGWEWRFIPVELSVETTITVNMTLERSSSWGSFCDFTILCDDATYAPIALSAAKAELQAVIDAAPAVRTKNIGDGAFQIPAAGVQTYSEALAAANTAKDATDATVTSLATAKAELEAAIATYNALEVNAPDANKLYNIIVAEDGNAKEGNAVVIMPGTTGANNPTGYALNVNLAPNTNLNQAVTFTKVSGDSYTISFETAAGTTYLTTGSLNGSAAGWNKQQIQATTDADKKCAFTIVAAEEDNVFYIYNPEFNDYIDYQDGGSLYTDTNIDHKAFSLVETTKPSITINTTAAGWGTTMLPFAVASLPDGVKAYTCAEVSGQSLTLIEVTTGLEANKPYIIEGSWEAVLTGDAQGTALTYTEGLLTGTYKDIDAPDGKYIMQKQNEKVGFFLVDYAYLEGNSLNKPRVKANRAYLTTPAAGGVKAFFLGDTEDAIKGVFDGVAAGEIYDLAGRKVQNMQKGNVYIVNGKKVIVK